MNNIEVKNCNECPFHHLLQEDSYCVHPSNESPIDLDHWELHEKLGHDWLYKTIHPNCPLKQSPVTIKLSEHD